MNILYAGELNPTGTCHSRFRALKRLENNIETMDCSDLFKWDEISKLRRFIERYTLLGKKIRHANSVLLEKIRERKTDVLWVDTAYWVYKETLEEIKKEGVFLIHYTTDAFFPINKKLFLSRRLMRKTINVFDVLITTNSTDYKNFLKEKKYQGVNFISSKNGYDSLRFNEKDINTNHISTFKHELVFIGHHEPETERKVIELVKANLPIVVYGNHHWASSKASKFLKENLRPALKEKDYEIALKHANIALCFVSHWNYNSTAGRSFEITRSGTFLLAERTLEHGECFIEDEEAVFFGNDEEMINKIRYYLDNKVERENIASKGLDRCKNSEYSWQDNINRDWKMVKKIIENRI